MYQPMALHAFNLPGILIGSPLASVSISPVTGSPFRSTLPASLTSKAMEFALRVEVVFRLKLTAIRKSLAPMAVAPVLGTNEAGPKSGFPCGLLSFDASPSYSPDRTIERFFLSGLLAADSYK